MDKFAQHLHFLMAKDAHLVKLTVYVPNKIPVHPVCLDTHMMLYFKIVYNAQLHRVQSI